MIHTPELTRQEIKDLVALSHNPVAVVSDAILNASNMVIGKCKGYKGDAAFRSKIIDLYPNFDKAAQRFLPKRMVRATPTKGKHQVSVGMAKWIKSSIGGNYIPMPAYDLVERHWPGAEWFLSLHGSSVTAVHNGHHVAIIACCDNCGGSPAGESRIKTPPLASPRETGVFHRILTVVCGCDFRRIFGRELSPYMDPMFLFDILKFEEDMYGSGREESLHDLVMTNHGEEGMHLIELLIGKRPFTAEQKKHSEQSLGIDFTRSTIRKWWDFINPPADPEHDLEVIPQR